MIRIGDEGASARRFLMTRLVGPFAQAVPMTRRITKTFHGWDQPEVVVTLPERNEHAGDHAGLLRAWAVDDETGDWWGMCSYYLGVGVQMLGWIHQDHLRPASDDAWPTQAAVGNPHDPGNTRTTSRLPT
jgi:hypothetical protein